MSRDATSTRSSRPTSRIRATRRGATICSWGATEPGAMAPSVRDQAHSPLFPVDPSALSALQLLWDAGYAAYLVGGGVRDALLDRATDNWDLATSARPEQVLEVFPSGRNQNRFGTVVVGPVGSPIEITTFRNDRNYGDHRRPDEVTFT